MVHQFEVVRALSCGYTSGSSLDVCTLMIVLSGGKFGGKGKAFDRAFPLKFFQNQFCDGRFQRGVIEFDKDSSCDVVFVAPSMKGLHKYCQQDRAVVLFIIASDDIDESWAFARKLQRVPTANLLLAQQTVVLQSFDRMMTNFGLDLKGGVEAIMVRKNKVPINNEGAHVSEDMIARAMQQFLVNNPGLLQPQHGANDGDGDSGDVRVIHLFDRDAREHVDARFCGSFLGQFQTGGSSGFGLVRDTPLFVASGGTFAWDGVSGVARDGVGVFGSDLVPMDTSSGPSRTFVTPLSSLMLLPPPLTAVGSHTNVLENGTIGTTGNVAHRVSTFSNRSRSRGDEGTGNLREKKAPRDTA